MKRAVHVLFNGGKWTVRLAGSTRCYRRFDTKAQALALGRDMAMRRGAELVVGREDGTACPKESQGDPFPPRGFLEGG